MPLRKLRNYQTVPCMGPRELAKNSFWLYMKSQVLIP